MLYIVLMNRWGDPELHSYVLGAYSTKELAENMGLKESLRRGGKYDPDIRVVELDK
jgi:hypothetical protein